MSQQFAKLVSVLIYLDRHSRSKYHEKAKRFRTVCFVRMVRAKRSFDCMMNMNCFRVHSFCLSVMIGC